MNVVRKLLDALRRPDRRHAPRAPRTTLRAGRSVPAALVRLSLLALCLTTGAAVAQGMDQWWVVLVVGVLVSVRPHGALLAIGVAVLVGVYAVSGQHWWQLPVLVLLTHALLLLGAVADAVSWRGWVEVAVLRDELPRFLGVQAVAQAAVALALLLDDAAPVPWLVVGGVGALAALSWVVVSQVRDSTRR